MIYSIFVATLVIKFQ